MGTLNDSLRPGEVMGMDYVGPVDGKYMLVKVDFFRAWFSWMCVILQMLPIRCGESTPHCAKDITKRGEKKQVQPSFVPKN